MVAVFVWPPRREVDRCPLGCRNEEVKHSVRVTEACDVMPLLAIYPGDVGTAGGVVADEHARVLRADGSPIPGLYACGNASAPVFGRCYPGAGASIAASFTFGFIAARHCAASSETGKAAHVQGVMVPSP